MLVRIGQLIFARRHYQRPMGIGRNIYIRITVKEISIYLVPQSLLAEAVGNCFSSLSLLPRLHMTSLGDSLNKRDKLVGGNIFNVILVRLLARPVLYSHSSKSWTLGALCFGCFSKYFIQNIVISRFQPRGSSFDKNVS